MGTRQIQLQREARSGSARLLGMTQPHVEKGGPSVSCYWLPVWKASPFMRPSCSSGIQTSWSCKGRKCYNCWKPSAATDGSNGMLSGAATTWTVKAQPCPFPWPQPADVVMSVVSEPPLGPARPGSFSLTTHSAWINHNSRIGHVFKFCLPDQKAGTRSVLSLLDPSAVPVTCQRIWH